MRAATPDESARRARLVARTLAIALPFFGYLATGSAHGYWLDGGEFVSASIDLDIAHPPGQPLAVLLGRLFAYLPLGPLAYRVALGQAACAALAAGAAFEAFHTTSRALGVRDAASACAVALAGAWAFAGIPGVWFQAVRPEVYALQSMLLAITLERCVALEAGGLEGSLAPLYQGALAFGLSLTNHHFMALLVLPALSPTLARVLQARGARPLAVAGALFGAGLLVYLYLPVRASTSPPADLGHPTDPASFFWVVSARVYQGSHALASDPLPLRVLDVVLHLVEGLHPVVVVLALAGSWALVRTRGARRFAWIWIATFALAAGGRGALGFVSRNPDALGYLAPAFLAGVALATALVSIAVAGLEAQRRASPRAPRMLPRATAALAVALGLAQLARGAEASTLTTFDATDDFDARRVLSLPSRAVVIATTPQTVFRHGGAIAEGRVRPDVSLVAMPFLGYPGVANALVAREPALAELVGQAMVDGALSAPPLQSLAASRPVLVEMDPTVPVALFDTLAPRGLYYEVVDGGAAASDVREGASARHDALASLEADLGAARSEQETTAQLLWVHYGDALYFAQMGALDAARTSVASALSLAPESNELLGLTAALAAPEARGPLDITPFRVGLEPPPEGAP